MEPWTFWPVNAIFTLCLCYVMGFGLVKWVQSQIGNAVDRVKQELPPVMAKMLPPVIISELLQNERFQELERQVRETQTRLDMLETEMRSLKRG